MARLALPTLPPPTHISYSAINTYLTCPLRYYFRYIIGLYEETVSASLVLGGSIHAAVQHHFESLLAGLAPPDLDTLLDVFWDAWRDRESVRIQYARGEDINHIARLVERMLRSFQGSAFARPEGTIVGVEEELRGQVLPGLPDLLARVDLITETEDVWVVTDLKTSRTAWSPNRVYDSACQLVLYRELVKPLARDKPVRLEFVVLTRSKIPEVVHYPVPLDANLVRRTLLTVERVWHGIQAGLFYPTPSPAHCISCPYRRPCRNWPAEVA